MIFLMITLTLPALSGCPQGWPRMAHDRSSTNSQLRQKKPSALPAYRYPDTPPLLDANDLQTFVGRFRHRVVLLDVWASRCRRSLAEMQELARLQARLQEEGLQIISCNLDDASRWRTDTIPALHKAGASFPCVVMRPGEKAGLRSWLAPRWSYDLPARFLIDRQGRVVRRIMSDEPLAMATEQARRLVLWGDDDADHGGLPPGVTGLRIKLIDVRRGTSESLPEVTAAETDPHGLAKAAAAQISEKVGCNDHPRIAILPFGWLQKAGLPQRRGDQVARHVLARLRERGHDEVVGPAEAKRMIAKTGATAVAIEFDPSRVQGRLACDYLVLGWLREGPGQSRPKHKIATRCADQNSTDAP